MHPTKQRFAPDRPEVMALLLLIPGLLVLLTIALHELPQSSASAYTADSKILAGQIVHQEVTLRGLVLDHHNMWAMLHFSAFSPGGPSLTGTK